MGTRDGMEAMLKVADLYDQLASRSEKLGKVDPDVTWREEAP
jgi:hypothetical protein